MDPLTYTTNQAQLFLLAFVRIASMLALHADFRLHKHTGTA